MKKNELFLIGCASGLAGADVNSGQGPLFIQKSALFQELKKEKHIEWDAMLVAPSMNAPLQNILKELNENLAKKVSNSLSQEKKICVLGGDHTCAIGTWSGAYNYVRDRGDLGLIWIDAHMDSHTPETSESGRIHGMPLATLLGYGYQTLTQVLLPEPKIKPENLCLIGVRSFEKGEADLLKKLNVRVYFMDEVQERGLEKILHEAQQYVSKRTAGYGISLDLDGLDPRDAPGVDVPEPNGIRSKELLSNLPDLFRDPKLILTEIVEFDPFRDVEQKTEKLIINYLGILMDSCQKN